MSGTCGPLGYALHMVQVQRRNRSEDWTAQARYVVANHVLFDAEALETQRALIISFLCVRVRASL